MKLIKNFVSKLLGGKSSAPAGTSKSSAKTPRTKSGTHKKSSENAAKSESKPNAPAGKSRRGSQSRPKSPNKQDRSRRPRQNSGNAQPRSQEDGTHSSRSRDESNGSASQSRAAGEGREDRNRRRGDRDRQGSSERPPRRRRDQRKRPDSEQVSGQVSARTGGVARPRSQEGKGPRTRSSGGTRPGGAVSVEESARLQATHADWDKKSFSVEPAEGKKRFQDFDLPSEIMHAVSDLGFEYCTPIQALSLEHALAGKNVAGKAQTGTGKTAAFLIAILTRYLRSPEKQMEKAGVPRALVIAPTRELVIQICKDAADLGKYCGLRTLAIYGGMDYDRQKKELLAAPIDLLVATPGRLLDYSRQRVIDLSQVDTLVIDEADRMLDMGFIPDVRVIMNRLPSKDKRGTMLYSATLSEDVMRLASQWMDKPVHIEIESENMTTDTVNQVVYVVTASEKFTVLYNLLQQYPDTRILVFCNRKSTTEGIVRKLQRLNVSCDMLSGDVNQNKRLRVLEDFRDGKVRVVIATDVAGRGIHVDDVGFVVNYDFPYEAEDYVHRIGRTGRAGQEGTAISFADEDESFIIPEIEAFIKQPLKCTMLLGDDPLMADIPKFGRARPPRAQHPRHDHKTAATEVAKAPDTIKTSEKSVAASSEENTAPATNAPAHTPERERPSAVEAQRPETEKSFPVEKALESKKTLKPEKEPEPKKPSETEKASEDNARDTVKKDFSQRKPRGRGASRPARTAAPARAPAPPRRLRDPNVDERNRGTIPEKIVTKGPRFSEEWVPGQ
ncbi:MAG: DEAD/DEAH box helicase [Kiritimatiellae bacterium]|nr:DEAD/DEAH box helicase [Kiritimatiellia bacterium]